MGEGKFKKQIINLKKAYPLNPSVHMSCKDFFYMIEDAKKDILACKDYESQKRKIEKWFGT